MNFKRFFKEDNEMTEDLLHDYFENNEKKKELTKYLKTQNEKIKAAMVDLGKDKYDTNGYRVSISTPDKSEFDKEKLLNYLLDNYKQFIAVFTKPELDEEGLATLIDMGEVDLEELKKVAWVDKKGSPTLRISKNEET